MGEQRPYLLGAVAPDKTPTEGKKFEMYYYNVGGSPDYGICDIGIIENLREEGGTLLFEVEGETYCLEKLLLVN